MFPIIKWKENLTKYRKNGKMNQGKQKATEHNHSFPTSLNYGKSVGEKSPHKTSKYIPRKGNHL